MSFKTYSLIEMTENRNYYIKILMDRYMLSYFDAQDLVSETVYKLLKRDPKLRLTKGYLLSACCFTTIDHLRKVDRLNFVEEIPSVIAIDTDNGFTYKELRSCIYMLYPIRRDALILKFRFNMKQREIAEFYGIPANTAGRRVSLGQADLRNLIE